MDDHQKANFYLNNPNLEILNPEINWDNLREDFSRNNIVIIKDLLKSEIAEYIWSAYFHQDKNFWDLAIYPDKEKKSFQEGGYPVCVCKYNDVKSQEKIKYIRELNNSTSSNDFTYMYFRTQKNISYLNLWKLKEFKEKISYITEFQDLELHDNMNFVSCYEEGHYNGPHVDGIQGRLAFVYHLSKNWRPWYGGLFLRLDWNWSDVNSIISPPFNALALFNVDRKNNGSPHLVTEVAQGIKNKRIAYTGWYH
jgi:Rps23 Pro-64 3,4-dihydroxylase Tpa1-like proline 4-hydroxylase